MSGPGALTYVGQQPILTLVLHDPVAEKVAAQKLANKTKTLTLVLRDPSLQKAASDLPTSVTIILHDPAAEKAGLKKSINAAHGVLYQINHKLSSHKPQEGYMWPDKKVTVLLSGTVNPQTTQDDIAAIKALRDTVEKIEGIILEHVAGFEEALQEELDSFRTTTKLLKGRCHVLSEKQQDVSAMQAQASRVHKAIFGIGL